MVHAYFEFWAPSDDIYWYMYSHVGTPGVFISHTCCVLLTYLIIEAESKP